jgi:molecular chaperone IbpA
MTRNLSIWNDLRPFSIGFDNLFDQFDHYLDNRSTSFPTYNIVKGKDELNWTIEMALAGYSKKDIEVTRSFTTADDVEVKGAEMKDGMLSIALEKIVPEAKKPRTINIS